MQQNIALIKFQVSTDAFSRTDKRTKIPTFRTQKLNGISLFFIQYGKSFIGYRKVFIGYGNYPVRILQNPSRLLHMSP